MLRVTVELVPHGIENQKREIASMIIGNVGSRESGTTYRVTRKEAGNPMLGIPREDTMFHIHDHDRRQSVWDLIAKAAEKHDAA